MPKSRIVAAGVVFACAGVAGGCTDEPPVPTGSHYQYVVADLRVPGSISEAKELGFDLDRDRDIDNQLGSIFATLNTMGLGVGGMAGEALLRGGLIMLADLQTEAFDEAGASGFTVYLGGDPRPPACADPDDLATCGQHLLGTASFTVMPDAVSDLAVAPIVKGRYEADMARMPVQLALDPANPLRLDLHAARVRLTNITANGATAVLAGGVTEDDVKTIVVPEAARQIVRIVSEECGTTCSCAEGSGGHTLLYYFDFDKNCEVTLTEVTTSNVVSVLTAPDVTVGGQKLLSFGVGVELVPATFDAP